MVPKRELELKLKEITQGLGRKLHNEFHTLYVQGNIIRTIRFLRSKTPVQLLSSALNKVRILILYLFRFLKFYPPSNVPLPKGEAGTFWELSKPENVVPTLRNFGINHYFIFFISLSLLQASRVR
jgi:hypothetical protein